MKNNLPKFEGTPKQIAWAEDIRKEQIENAQKQMEKEFELGGSIHTRHGQLLKTWIEILENRTSAPLMIDDRKMIWGEPSQYWMNVVTYLKEKHTVKVQVSSKTGAFRTTCSNPVPEVTAELAKIGTQSGDHFIIPADKADQLKELVVKFRFSTGEKTRTALGL